MDFCSVWLRGTDEAYICAGAAAHVMGEVLTLLERSANPWLVLEVPLTLGDDEVLQSAFFDAREIAAIMPLSDPTLARLHERFG